MEFRDTIGSAWTSLRSNKLRTALTLLGMVIGVFAIITSVTAVKVIDVYFRERMAFLGSATFTVSRYPAIQMGNRQWEYRKNITYDQVQRLAEMLGDDLTVSIQEDFALSSGRSGGRQTDPNVVVIGTNEHFLGNYSFELAEGRFFTAQDVHYVRRLMVLGAAVADELFPAESPISKVIQVDGRRYQVVGVLAPKGNFLGFNMDNRVFAPITQLFSTYGEPQRNIATVSIRALTVEAVPPAMDEVVGRFRTIRKVPPGAENDFELETNDSMRGVFETFTATLTLGGAVIGFIALFAAGIGIMNIMLVSVTERTREIGIRKAVGARRADILRQFILEAVFLCQIGGLLGILLGVAVGNLVAVYFDISAAIPWMWAVAAVVMVAGVALVFGGYPAFRAARLDPIQSLRYE